MKILFITSRFPKPIDKGDKLRVYQQLRFLSKKHEVYLFSLARNKLEKSDILSLKEFIKEIKVVNLTVFSSIKNVIKAIFTGIPFQSALFYSPKAQKEFDKFTIKISPNILLFQLIRTGEFSISALDHKTITFFDYVDVLSKGLERRKKKTNIFLKLLLEIEYKRVRQYEKKMYKKYDQCLIITNSDREELPLNRPNKVSVIPNGIDMNYFDISKFKYEKDIDLLFLGNMSYPPNIIAVKYFVDNIYPLIIEKIPNVKLYIVGANPSSSIKKLDKIKNITVTGWVADVREFYARSKVFIAPMQIGTGLQNKILEAMSMQVPAVISFLAQKGINASDGLNILVEDEPEKFAKKCIELILKTKYSKQIGYNARKFVIENYSLEFIGSLLENKMTSKLTDFNK